MEFEASDGERRRYAPGNALLLEDTTGKKDTAAGYSGPPTRFSRLSSCEL
jgi:hypothetical protein